MLISDTGAAMEGGKSNTSEAIVPNLNKQIRAVWCLFVLCKYDLAHHNSTPFSL